MRSASLAATLPIDDGGGAEAALSGALGGADSNGCAAASPIGVASADTVGAPATALAQVIACTGKLSELFAAAGGAVATGGAVTAGTGESLGTTGIAGGDEEGGSLALSVLFFAVLTRGLTWRTSGGSGGNIFARSAAAVEVAFEVLRAGRPLARSAHKKYTEN